MVNAELRPRRAPFWPQFESSLLRYQFDVSASGWIRTQRSQRGATLGYTQASIEGNLFGSHEWNVSSVELKPSRKSEPQRKVGLASSNAFPGSQAKVGFPHRLLSATQYYSRLSPYRRQPSFTAPKASLAVSRCIFPTGESPRVEWILTEMRFIDRSFSSSIVRQTSTA